MIYLELQFSLASKKELKKFAEFSHKWVIEVNSEKVKSIQGTLKRHYFSFFPYWINAGKNTVAVVQITSNSFHSFGVSDQLNEDIVKEIFKMIIDKITKTATSYIKANASERFLPLLEGLGFKSAYGREKYILKLDQAKGIKDYSGLNLEKLDWTKMGKIIKLFLNAYEGTIDEKIGLFGKKSAPRALRMVMNNEFGKVKNNYSYFTLKNNEYTGGVITSINDDELFIVIIGVHKAFQRISLGRKLMSLIIEKGKKDNYKELSLWVTKKNESAIGFYKSLGFKKQSGVYSMKLQIE